MTIKRISDSLNLIPLNLPREGFHHFICTWIYSRDDAVVLVDPGPRSTIPALLKALEEMNVGHIDYVLLTHIHLDHAGGLGLLLKHYPDAKAICHRKGIPHLVEPSKLWKASKKVLGDIADLYGGLDHVPAANIDFMPNILVGSNTVTVYETPGHAPHHLSYKIGDMLFAGEALGIFYPMGKDTYLRIASPPGFDIRDHKKSLGLLKNLDIAALCFGHYGISYEIEKIFELTSAQTELWSTVIGQYSYLESPLFEEKVLDELLPVDPGLSCFHQLPDDIKKREIYFLGNSFKGFKVAIEREEYSL
ncbi:MAG: MBL fold metallo-hydrolase [Deltaproteobacteria bacterium]|nr:MBL fold metallo-hydrolase [Deltaproteobacteria bacterium]